MKIENLAGRHRSVLKDPAIYATVSKLTDADVRVAFGKVRHSSHARPKGSLRIKREEPGGTKVVLYGVEVLVEAVLYGTDALPLQEARA